MKILVLGCKGQLGRCLNDQLKKTDHEVIYTSRKQIDITKFELTKDKLFDIAPDVIINATAFTAVDKAEEEQEAANFINHLAVKNIAGICKQLDCWLFHVSTDYVFDGSSQIPYKENFQTNPQSIYGKTKLKGELAIQSAGCKHIIIRTAWLFSEHGSNFLKNMLLLGAERKEISVVDDQVGCPTYAQDIAAAFVKILPYLGCSSCISGIYNYSGDSACSWFQLAEEIFDQMSKYSKRSIPIVKAISSDEFPSLAHRPHYSVLNSDLIKKVFGIGPSNWKSGVANSLKHIYVNEL